VPRAPGPRHPAAGTCAQHTPLDPPLDPPTSTRLPNPPTPLEPLQSIYAKPKQQRQGGGSSSGSDSDAEGEREGKAGGGKEDGGELDKRRLMMYEKSKLRYSSCRGPGGL
jgi:hypothetical protein